jgi:hypothetical protein
MSLVISGEVALLLRGGGRGGYLLDKADGLVWHDAAISATIIINMLCSNKCNNNNNKRANNNNDNNNKYANNNDNTNNDNNKNKLRIQKLELRAAGLSIECKNVLGVNAQRM